MEVYLEECEIYVVWERCKGDWDMNMQGAEPSLHMRFYVSFHFLCLLISYNTMTILVRSFFIFFHSLEIMSL